MKNTTKASAPTTNQLQKTRPSIPTTAAVLPGYIENSMNGGHERAIAYVPVMAGTKIYQYGLKLKLTLLTPKTPAYQKLKCRINTYWVPNSAVMTNWENFEAQIKNPTEVTIEEEPNFGGKVLPVIQKSQGGTNVTLITNTTAWRNSWISSYIPRVGYFQEGEDGLITEFAMPKYSALPARGRVMIYNAFGRNKEYAEKLVEYKDDTVSAAEWASYIPGNGQDIDVINMRAKKPNGYFMNYRTSYQGLEEEAPDLTDVNNNMVTWASWAAKIAEGRSQAESAQDNTWTKIAKIRGSQAALERKPQKLTSKEYTLNFTPVTQDTYNVNGSVEEQFQVLGKQGAYSFTEIEVPSIAGWEPKETGYIHVTATVYAETIYETGFERTGLNVKALDKYRPDLKDDKLDVIYSLETNGNANFDGEPQAFGFKRRFNEYGKLPNIIAGDMTNNNWFESTLEEGALKYTDTQVIPQKTYTYMEESRTHYMDNDNIKYKKGYLDYTDVMLNKNQAIKNKWNYDELLSENETPNWLAGQQQIFISGEHIMVAELPIDESILTNFQKWGEE